MKIFRSAAIVVIDETVTTAASSGTATSATASVRPLRSVSLLGALPSGLALALCALAVFASAVSVAQAAPARSAAAASSSSAASAKDRPETVITSDELDMIGGEDSNRFFFRRNVRIEATNMVATCEQMEIIAARQGQMLTDSLSRQGAAEASRLSGTAVGASAADASSSASPSSASAASAVAPAADAQKDDMTSGFGSIREIIMTGNVVISQEGRRATAGRAVLYPQEGRVVLSGNPQVTDDQGTLSGYEMELLRGEKTVRVISAPDGGRRTSVTLPSIGNLGFDAKTSGDKKDAEQTAPASQTPAGTPAASASGSAQNPAQPSAQSPAQNANAAQGATASPSASSSASASASAGAAAAPSSSAPAADAAAKESAPAAKESNSRGWRPVTGGRR